MNGKRSFKTIRVAVLGAGVMGSSVALLLARKGAQVTLIDGATEPFCRASRWNEGKIHLGYLYSADLSLQTARALLPGGIAFKQLTEELIGTPLKPAITAEDDLYFVHRDSVVCPDVMGRYFEAVAGLVRTHPDASSYLVDASYSRIQVLSRRELEALTDTRVIIGGFRVPERSVWTGWIADRYVEAISAEPCIELLPATRVIRVRPAETSIHGRWHVETEPDLATSYDVVINALWEGRPAVDATAGLKIEPGWSHRYRLALFVHTTHHIDVPNAVLAVGPFGDIKNYTGKDFYLSWYPAGLVAEGQSLKPPALPYLDEADRDLIVNSVAAELGNLIPSAKAVIAAARATIVEGGWVFAIGKGSLRDPLATVHRRYRFGIRRVGSYISVDTGKYSIAAWLARQVADQAFER